MSRARRLSGSSVSRSSSRYKGCCFWERTGQGFHQQYLTGALGLLSLHLAWYHGTIVKVTNFRPDGGAHGIKKDDQKHRDTASNSISQRGHQNSLDGTGYGTSWEGSW